jgi:hypothetical protein
MAEKQFDFEVAQSNANMCRYQDVLVLISE